MSKLLSVKTPPLVENGDPIPMTFNVLNVVTIEPDLTAEGVTLVTLDDQRVIHVMEPYEAISGVIVKRAS